ncbi:arginine transporter [Brenneria goodwinii]|uniref:Arginine exporter protein ArgO n=1 Tax=Brenneria goodwinii TaxID=1109412 RepID=A0A0G4JVF8_9GAMM|nr:arginine exporter ArgO [Brenneria goodwinii]ATA26568.1 arginine transporter [Brenneria goodwinii]MCG8156341.1 arginine exporter ArgO [Brenneria goodwinii]MCG8160920.1 arginine exporter ArgO [Brenneria goodwinii]MCG8166232.1 arginine exporter ArgO [Brenneria goodwinii]MCG8169757.1 arginine exporter ArgO [Brenneria goodwinii]
MLAVYLQGFIFGAAMILPLGPQNAFVMNQGIRRQYHLMIAFLCSLSDVVLICAGVFGGSALLSQSSLLMGMITWGGVAFLLWYGWGAFKTVFSKDLAVVKAEMMKQSRWRILATMLAVTWLNPHVYLDTFVVLGSLGSQFAGPERSWFALGSVTASFLWFFALALLAAWLSPWLNTPRVQRAINLFVGVVMWGIALQLARHGWQ